MRQPAEPEPAPFARRVVDTVWAAVWAGRGAPGWGVVVVAAVVVGVVDVVRVEVPSAVMDVVAVRVALWGVVHCGLV